MAGVTFDLDALDRIAEANKRVPEVLRRHMTDAARSIVVPAFQQEMRRRGQSMQKRTIIPGSYAVAGFGGWTLVAGVSGEQLSGGARAGDLARAFEFGTSRPSKTSVVRLNPGGNSSTVRYSRVTTNQLPKRATKGWVAYPSGAAIIKRALPLYVQVCVKVLADAMEGTSS
jgi:hypothetical protein